MHNWQTGSGNNGRAWNMLEVMNYIGGDRKRTFRTQKYDFQMMLMIKRATFGMCCFPLCIVSAPTTRSMHPVCMYVYTLSIYICIYIYYYDYYDIYIYTYIHVYINMPICLQVHQYMHIWKILKNTLCGSKLQLDVENYPSYNVCVWECVCVLTRQITHGLHESDSVGNLSSNFAGEHHL